MGNSKFANRDDGQDGSLHDFVIEFGMFHMHVLWVLNVFHLVVKFLHGGSE